MTLSVTADLMRHRSVCKRNRALTCCSTLGCNRGPSSPSKSSRTSNCEEEGLAETLKQVQVDRFGLTDLKETLKALDDSCEIRWLTELLSLCLECPALMNMGNQQGTKLRSSTESGRASPKPPRIQIPRKRRRKAEGIVYAGTRQHNLKGTPKTPQRPAKARRITKPQITSSPMSEDWDFEENRAIIGTATTRRKRVKDREERRASLWEGRSKGLQSQCGGEQQPDASANIPRFYSEKAPVCVREDSCVQGERVLTDSDADLSEYDNDIYAKSNSQTSRSVGEALLSQSASQKYQEKKAEAVGKRPGQWSVEEMGKWAAAQRVLGKIAEVERIIRRVSFTNSEWSKESGEGGGEHQCISNGCPGEYPLQILQPSRRDAQFRTQGRESNEDKPLLVEDLWTLAEALSQSLHQTQSACESVTEAQRLTSDFSKVPINPSPDPSPSLSAILAATPRASSSFDRMSPIISPLFMSTVSSPGLHQLSAPLNLTDQREPDTSESHTGGTVEDWWVSRGPGTAVSSGTENEQRMNLTQTNLRANEQGQTQTFRCTSDASQDDLLTSDEALERQEQIWQQEVEESLSFCRSLSHPFRLKQGDFSRITAPVDDLSDRPTSPLPEFRLTGPARRCHKQRLKTPSAFNY
ncbi:hypothetical protein EXN66_Car018789 [Channa argus]|uniref:Uncharacterized protein n=1 Tax=Channa argus TaxID=215402 RepID=A0A6G1QK92_CHAAH|nr:hypothetical protein EXN66_Car018789 [Channa argus]